MDQSIRSTVAHDVITFQNFHLQTHQTLGGSLELNPNMKAQKIALCQNYLTQEILWELLVEVCLLASYEEI